MAAKLVSQQNMTKEFVVVTKNTDCLHKKKNYTKQFFQTKNLILRPKKNFLILTKKILF